jgi:hypothetical protein
VSLRSSAVGWLRDEPLLDWRGLMGELPAATISELPPPTAYFTLVPFFSPGLLGSFCLWYRPGLSASAGSDGLIAKISPA